MMVGFLSLMVRHLTWFTTVGTEYLARTRCTRRAGADQSKIQLRAFGCRVGTQRCPLRPVQSRTLCGNTRQAVRALGLHLVLVQASTEDKIDKSFADLQGATALLVSGDARFYDRRTTGSSPRSRAATSSRRNSCGRWNRIAEGARQSWRDQPVQVRPR
jgi:hypothetical protein